MLFMSVHIFTLKLDSRVSTRDMNCTLIRFLISGLRGGAKPQHRVSLRLLRLAGSERDRLPSMRSVSFRLRTHDAVLSGRQRQLPRMRRRSLLSRKRKCVQKVHAMPRGDVQAARVLPGIRLGVHVLQAGDVLLGRGPGVLAVQTMPAREARGQEVHGQAQHALQSLQGGHLLAARGDVRVLYTLPPGQRPERSLHAIRGHGVRGVPPGPVLPRGQNPVPPVLRVPRGEPDSGCGLHAVQRHGVFPVPARALLRQRHPAVPEVRLLPAGQRSA